MEGADDTLSSVGQAEGRRLACKSFWPVQMFVTMRAFIMSASPLSKEVANRLALDGGAPQALARELPAALAARELGRNGQASGLSCARK